MLKKPLMDTNDVQSQAPVIILTSDEDTDIPYPFPFPKTFGTDLYRPKENKENKSCIVRKIRDSTLPPKAKKQKLDNHQDKLEVR